MPIDHRVWYDQFTSTDWVHDSVQDGKRILELRKKKGIRGKLELWFDSAQGWILMVIIGCLTAAAAYFVDVTESAIFDIKKGFCRDSWYRGRVSCCDGARKCDAWQSWSKFITSSHVGETWIDYTAFTIGCVVLACLSCFITLYSKTVVPSHIASTFDENLAAVKQSIAPNDKDTVEPLTNMDTLPANIYYSAAGSGVAEVKVILSGFVLHGYLGLRTLILKMFALILSASSGMSLGKEGPYVHIATCIGNIACRLFSKFNLNDGKRREVLSASAASGVAVAFGSPLGGVLFSLEEVSYYFPPKTLFRTFVCCIAAALSLKVLNPYGTHKIVLFEVRYLTDWQVFELFNFAFVGAVGGLAGALFIKASRIWAKTFRRIPLIKEYPMLEVFLVALVTGLLSFWNRYNRLPVAQLLLELASPCDSSIDTGLCSNKEGLPKIIWLLTKAFVIKAFLTIITFGIKVPAGIYVPSMVVGGMMGRIVGHITQYIVLEYPSFFLWSACSSQEGMEACVTPGVYALVAAGATMCGVTRLSVTLAVILFELTGSLDHVLPFSLGVLCAKWTADAVEPLSIYDLLTDMNSYPFLDNKESPVFDSILGDITPRPRLDRVIDITISSLVKASELRAKLSRLQNAGELDGGIPVVRDKVLVGLIPAPDLEFALDHLEDEDNALCRIFPPGHPHDTHHRHFEAFAHVSEEDNDDDEADLLLYRTEPVDLSPYIDQAPVALDVHSPMDLVYQCFSKLGLRYMCVLDEGEYRGMVHKKVFVRYCKTMGKEGAHH
jgi:chloride channel 3/4/5